MKVPYQVVSLEQAIAALDPEQEVFFDTETKGLYGEIRLAQFYQAGLPEVLMVDTPNIYALATELAKLHTVMHNSHYDITTVQQNSGTRWKPAKYDDTFYLARLAFPEKEKFSLDDVMAYCLRYDPYLKQGLDKKALQKSDWSAMVLTPKQLQYAATDVYFMPQVWDKVKHKLDEFSYKLDILTTKLI